MAAPAIVTELIERFERNRDSYRSPHYKETQLRREFIDPFFVALGWDVENKRGHAEAYKDVVHEDAVKVGGATKAPDYSFRIGGTRKFFVETKKPAVSIKTDVSPAYQLRRYAWSAKLPLSVLTDFEEFAVYDCRVKPSPGDKASVGRTIYLDYTQYAERWDEIASIFAREAVLKGSFDKYAEKKRKRGTAEVDAAFLKDIEAWREDLAHGIALRNPKLTTRELNFSVQRTIDRIIFLRICEDRGIEELDRLRMLLNGTQVYARLFKIFQDADDRYNSGLFHFNKEKGRAEGPDELTPGLEIDDKLLKAIIKGLYYPDSPYEFSVLPADILGQVYEQFLGKVIRLTPGHRAKVEDKPEVKKAGGVYYTPTYIVDYIVQHTVGKLLEKSTPDKAAKLRILDPACGSGSFLIGAYQYLLDWHRQYYEEHDPAKWARKRPARVYEGRGGWRLTTAERKRILLKNVYGVDIDPQAVEVTKLSLLLKVLEGESGETLERQRRMFHERALPDLAGNIKCGNSLIGPDFYDGKQLALLDDEERYRINVFDWPKEFPDIMRAGGFDAVIGNPPWLMAGYYIGDEIGHMRRRFNTAQGKFDLYYLFLERGFELTKTTGRLGMIVPNKCFHTKAATKLRQLMQGAVEAIVDFGDVQVFRGATNYSCIVALTRDCSKNVVYRRAETGLKIVDERPALRSALSSDPWHFEERAMRDLFVKMEGTGQPLESLVARFGTGVQSGADRILTLAHSQAEEFSIEKDMLRSVLRGRDVRRYAISRECRLLVFPYKVENGVFGLLPENALMKHQNAYRLLCANREALTSRKWFGKGPEELSGAWYGMMYLDGYWAFSSPHILTPSLSNRSNFALGTGNLFATGTAGVTSIIPRPDIAEDIRYILGLLNSSLMSMYAVGHSPIYSGAYYKFSAPYLRGLPVRRVDKGNDSDVAAHDQTVDLVQQMLDLYEKVSRAKTAHDKELLRREIETTDRRIDQVVYGMYALSDREIRIVEGGSPASRGRGQSS